MDTTHGTAAGSADASQQLLEELAAVDPAEAPHVAEELAGLLSGELDASREGVR